MGSVILLSNRLRKAWTEKKINKNNSEIKNNANIEALKKIGINSIDEYYRLLISKMNEVNSKYKIESIEFVDEPVPVIGSNAINAGRIIKKVNDEIITQAYIFVSNPNLGSRNIFGSQQLFPGLSRLISHYIPSPSFDLANLPIYFVNGSTDKITNSMQETIMGMALMDVRYVQLFNEESLPDGLFRNNLVGYSRFISNEINAKKNGIVITDFYNLNYIEKKISFTTKTFKEDKIDSFGSSDRFFVIKAYPALILADKEKYSIDITKIQNFLSTYNKGKNNLEPFIQFAQKLGGRERR